MTSGQIIVTGASGSMGRAATEALVRCGRPVIMACRNMAKASAVRDSIIAAVPGAEIEILPLHLESFSSVRDFCASLQGKQIAGLFNNAGVIPRGYRLTEDGHEESIQVNYLAPVLLTELLKPAFAEDAAVVNMVSVTCATAHFDKDILHKDGHGFHRLGRYATSKLALMLYTIDLSRRSALRVNAADPGVVDSNMISMGKWFDPLADKLFRPLCRRPEEGAAPAVAALCSGERGQLFSWKGHCPFPQRFASRTADIEWLREASMKELGMLSNSDASV